MLPAAFLFGLINNQLGSRNFPMPIKLKKKKMDMDFPYFMNNPDLIVEVSFIISHCHVKKNIFVGWTNREQRKS